LGKKLAVKIFAWKRLKEVIALTSKVGKVGKALTLAADFLPTLIHK